jgi:CheY-like chemotaxis protein
MQTKTVLIIEENRLNLKLVREILGISNCQILEAMDAEAGYLLAQKHLPDLILMGSQLSGTDKLNTLKRIKTESALKDVPIIAITDTTRKDEKEKYYTAGWDNSITTPIDSKQFIETVGRFLDLNENNEKQNQLQHKILRMHAQYYVSILLINMPI